MCFNPRAREGATYATVYVTVITACFNPRAREGATRPRVVVRIWGPCFNPRAREGATDIDLADLLCDGVSIHAPVKARLNYINHGLSFGIVSIHAPVKARLSR